MKDFPTLKEFLIEYGVTESTPKEKIAELKQAYKKSYQHFYQKIRTSREKRIDVRLSLEEYRQFKRYAKAHRRTHLAPFIKEAVRAYAEKTYLAKNPTLITELIVQIRRIGNNINQVVQAMHVTRDYQNHKYYTELLDQIEDLKHEVEEVLRTPAELTPEMAARYLKAYIGNHPEHYEHLQRFVQNLDPNQASKPNT